MSPLRVDWIDITSFQKKNAMHLLHRQKEGFFVNYINIKNDVYTNLVLKIATDKAQFWKGKITESIISIFYKMKESKNMHFKNST